MQKIQKGQSVMEYLMTYGWAILIVIIVAAALYALTIPASNPDNSNEDWMNCSTFFFPAKVIEADEISAPANVKHFQKDLDFLDDLHDPNVWVYCTDPTIILDNRPLAEQGTKCGSFNNLGVFHWAYAKCNL